MHANYLGLKTLRLEYCTVGRVSTSTTRGRHCRLRAVDGGVGDFELPVGVRRSGRRGHYLIHG